MLNSDPLKKHQEEMRQKYELLRQQVEDEKLGDSSLEAILLRDLRAQLDQIDIYIKSIRENISYNSFEGIHLRLLRRNLIDLLSIYILFLLIMIYGMLEINFYLFLPSLILGSISFVPLIFSDYVRYRNFKRRMKL